MLFTVPYGMPTHAFDRLALFAAGVAAVSAAGAFMDPELVPFTGVLDVEATGTTYTYLTLPDDSARCLDGEGLFTRHTFTGPLHGRTRR